MIPENLPPLEDVCSGSKQTMPKKVIREPTFIEALAYYYIVSPIIQSAKAGYFVARKLMTGKGFSRKIDPDCGLIYYEADSNPPEREI